MGDALIIGRTIDINGDVEGSVVVLGENVTMNGQTGGSIYALAVSFNHLSEAVINRSLYFLGVSLVTERNSEIGRDLTAVTLGVRNTGDVGRSTKIVAGIEIVSLILDRINARTGGISFSEPVSQEEGGLLLLQSGEVELVAGSAGPILRTPRSALAQDEPTGVDGEQTATTIPLVNWLINRLRNLVVLLLVGGLLIWLAPSYLDHWADVVRTKPLASAGWGLVGYITGFVAFIILLLLIVVVGISFAAITLWTLAWAWWGVSLSILLLSFSLFLVSIVFISKIIVAYLVGKLLFERFGSKPNMRKPWPLLVGLVLYVLLSGIPYLGWALALITTFFGLGAMWIAYTGHDQEGTAGPAGN